MRGVGAILILPRLCAAPAARSVQAQPGESARLPEEEAPRVFGVNKEPAHATLVPDSNRGGTPRARRTAELPLLDFSAWRFDSEELERRKHPFERERARHHR